MTKASKCISNKPVCFVKERLIGWLGRRAEQPREAGHRGSGLKGPRLEAGSSRVTYAAQHPSTENEPVRNDGKLDGQASAIAVLLYKSPRARGDTASPL